MSVKKLNQKAARRVREQLRRNVAFGDQPVHESLKAILDCDPEPFAPLAWLLAYETDPRIRDHAMTIVFVTLREPAIPAFVRDEAKSALLPVLLDAMQDKSVADDRKIIVGPLLELCGHQLNDKEYRACFADFKAATASLNERLAEKELGLLEVEQILCDAGLYSPEESVRPTPENLNTAMGSAVTLIEHHPLAGSALSCIVAAHAQEHGLDEEFRTKPLEIVSALGGPHGRWFLSVLANQPGYGDLASRAAAFAEEMGKTGIQSEPPRLGKFSHGIVSSVDGAGSRSLMLFYHNEGELDGLALILNDEMGIKDFWTMWGNAAGADDEMRNTKDFRTIPCDLDMARELVGDALAIHAKRGVPPPAHALLSWHMLGLTPIPVKPHQPRLGVYMIESIVRSPDLTRGSDALVKDPAWGTLHNPSDEAYALMTAAYKRFKGKRNLVSVVMDSFLFDEFLALAEKHGRDTLLRRMAVNLEVEALAGRAKLPQNKLACFTWVAISENLIPFGSVPYVRALAEKEIFMMAHNVSLGEHSQRDVNAKVMNLEDEVRRLETDLKWLDREP